MTAQPTDADRAKAAEIAGAWWSWHVPGEVDGLRAAIAQALADERAHALAPVRSLLWPGRETHIRENELRRALRGEP